MSPRPLKMASPPAGERLLELIRALKLTRIEPVIDSLAQQCAGEKVGYLEFLERVLDVELEERREQEVVMLERFARFPHRKHLD